MLGFDLLGGFSWMLRLWFFLWLSMWMWGGEGCGVVLISSKKVVNGYFIL